MKNIMLQTFSSGGQISKVVNLSQMFIVEGIVVAVLYVHDKFSK